MCNRNGMLNKMTKMLNKTNGHKRAMVPKMMFSSMKKFERLRAERSKPITQCDVIFSPGKLMRFGTGRSKCLQQNLYFQERFR